MQLQQHQEWRQQVAARPPQEQQWQQQGFLHLIHTILIPPVVDLVTICEGELKLDFWLLSAAMGTAQVLPVSH